MKVDGRSGRDRPHDGEDQLQLQQREATAVFFFFFDKARAVTAAMVKMMEACNCTARGRVRGRDPRARLGRLLPTWPRRGVLGPRHPGGAQQRSVPRPGGAMVANAPGRAAPPYRKPNDLNKALLN
jgi:hypothetical protein